MRLEEQDAVDIAWQRCRRRVTNENLDVLPSIVFDPLARDSCHLLAQLDPGYLPCCTDDRPESPETRPRAAAHVKDVIAIAQLEALDSTTSERGHEPDVCVVAGGELTVSAPSLSGVRRRPGFHLGSLHVDRRGRRAILNLLSPLSRASRISRLIWFGVPFLHPPVLGCPLPAIVLFGSTLDSEGRFRPPSWASLLPDGGTAVMGHLCVQE